MTLRLEIVLAAFIFSAACHAQSVNGQLAANGAAGLLSHVAAYEVDSPTERGYMDVVLLFSDRKLPREAALNTGILQEMMLKNGLVALRVVIDPDGRVKSAAPFHPALKTFIQSAAFVKWKPSAYNVNKIAGRLYTGGEQQLAGQHWSYDITFSAPITLDPEAKTVPQKK